MLNTKTLYISILGFFSVLMFEYLNLVTLGVIAIGLIAYYFNLRPSKIVRSTFAISLFILYWLVYGKMIEPEIGLNFLTSIIILKILEKESLRDDYMIFYGTLLLVAAGTLFEKNLRYSFFAVFSLILLVVNFLATTKQERIYSYAMKSIVWMLPVCAFMFIFTPRIPNPFNMNESGPRKGEIGYTTSVMISEIDSLKSNTSKVFHAKVQSPLPLEALYWRGNVLEFTDGWNWPFMESSVLGAEIIKSENVDFSFIQDVSTLSKQDYYFGLDWPGSFSSQETNATGSLKQDRWRPRQNYQVKSSLSEVPRIILPEKGNKYTGLKREEEAWIHSHFSSSEPEELIKEVSDYFFKNKFAYTLSPGKIESLLSFMVQEKKGYCSHYASAVALIMRTKGVTVRLVSGFLGGEYNKYAKFYTIAHNDAHVWIEYIKDGKWHRIDPTTWIAPERIQQSATTFIEENLSENQFTGFRFLRSRFSWLDDLSQWIAHLDYRYNIWIEEFDFYSQEQIFLKFKYNKK